jgi:hypothetical protein
MERLEKLREANPGLEILPATDPSFAAYGRLLHGLETDPEAAYAQEHIHMTPSVSYDAIVPGLEGSGQFLADLQTLAYGQMPAQLGWCYGHNLSLDGLEYHKGDEINLALTDVVLMLAQFSQIHWETKPWLDSAAVRLFFIPAGTVYELFSWCLHFAPQQVSEQDGFCTLVALPRGTNTPLDAQPEPKGENLLLFGKNKWLLVHPEAQGLVQAGAYPGIRGKNLKLNTLP